eukprot:CFRG8530T1
MSQKRTVGARTSTTCVRHLATNRLGIDVVFDHDMKAPSCAHGPTLLFERYTVVGKVPVRYFACSAFRDRKMCPFYRLEDDVRRRANKLESDSHFVRKASSSTNQNDENQHASIHTRLLEEARACLALSIAPSAVKNITGDYTTSSEAQENRNTKDSKRAKKLGVVNGNDVKFCPTCARLVTSTTVREHDAHSENLSKQAKLTLNSLLYPTRLLPALNNDKTNAQYFFSKQTTSHMVGEFKRLGLKNVLCVGTPRLHEVFQAEENDIKSLLIDLDHRFEAFFPNSFAHYNMCNGHFFDDYGSVQYTKFMTVCDVIVVDPPFGLLPEVLAKSLERIGKDSRKMRCKLRNAGTNCKRSDAPAQTTESDTRMVGNMNNSLPALPIFLIMPYFMEPKLSASMPDLHMYDYRVQYENHDTFKTRERTSVVRDSPVRMFTNFPLGALKPTPEKDYKYCNVCKHHVAVVNRHCEKCKSCTTKHGLKPNDHCDKCARCVSAGSNHCDSCGFCFAPSANHICDNVISKAQRRPITGQCHVCGKTNHKRKDCPKRRKMTE